MIKTSPAVTYKPQPLDIVACWGRDYMSRLITAGTYWPRRPRELRWGPSHVALVVPYRDRNRGLDGLYWLESTTKCPHPCIVSNRCISGIQLHRIEDRINDYTEHGGTVRTYSLQKDFRPSLVSLDYLENEIVKRDIGSKIPYDLLGAGMSRTIVLRNLLRMLGARRDHLFCSDLIALYLMRLGLFPADDPDAYYPGKLLNWLIPKPYGLTWES